MEKKKDQQSITFEYRISSNYMVHAVSGVHGGVNGHGQIVANFFSERGAIPKTETYLVNPDGSLPMQPNSTERKNAVIRDVIVAVSIPPDAARAIGQWLIEKADFLLKFQNSQKAVPNDKETKTR